MVRSGLCRCRNVRFPNRVGQERSALGIPTVTDRIVQAGLKLVLEPIFEADFEPVSYGLRPNRRAQDAIAEIHHFGTRGYRWVLDADIEACFHRIDHHGSDGAGALPGEGQTRFGAGQGVLESRDLDRAR
ncbi:reverse transcriptase/maturase family protein [Nonomuraea fuscirosea]|uniref:reverse transcriptase/maturase family protein n=1 Tax=Nonomuraea fuscirosea TaxID=1291556 RepID=UPI0031843120